MYNKDSLIHGKIEMLSAKTRSISIATQQDIRRKCMEDNILVITPAWCMAGDCATRTVESRLQDKTDRYTTVALYRCDMLY